MFVKFIEIKHVRSKSIRMKSDSKHQWTSGDERIKTYLRKLREVWLHVKTELLLSGNNGRDITSRKHRARQDSYALIALQSSEAQLKFPRKFLIRPGHLSQRETARTSHP